MSLVHRQAHGFGMEFWLTVLSGEAVLKKMT